MKDFVLQRKDSLIPRKGSIDLSLLALLAQINAEKLVDSQLVMTAQIMTVPQNKCNE